MTKRSKCKHRDCALSTKPVEYYVQKVCWECEGDSYAVCEVALRHASNEPEVAAANTEACAGQTVGERPHATLRHQPRFYVVLL